MRHRAARYDTRLGPPLLQALAATMGVPEPLLRRWWQALCAAHWTLASAFRERLIHFTPEHHLAPRFVTEVCSPTVLVTIVEQLVLERHLYRSAATQIEEQIFRYCDAQGQWTGAMQRPGCGAGAGEQLIR